jgi:hypothetical protein
LANVKHALAKWNVMKSMNRCPDSDLALSILLKES